MQRINITQVETSERFYQFPKMLLEDNFYSKMSLEAKMLYTIMKDRHMLSLKNKWVDEYGDVYIIFTNNQAAEKLGCGETKAKKIRAELIEYGLIEVVPPKGMGKRASHIYVGNLAKHSVDDAIGTNTDTSDHDVLSQGNNENDTHIEETVMYIANHFTEQTDKELNSAQKKVIKDWIVVGYDIAIILEAITQAAIHGSSNLNYVQKTIQTQNDELQDAINRRALEVG